MLKIIRKQLKLILWTLIVAFVLWEIGTVLATRQSGSVYAGTLYGRPVTIQAFKAAWEASHHRALLAYGERARELVPPDQLNRYAWDHLLLVTAARRAGIRVTDRQVVEDLKQWPLFQRDGQFDPHTYQLVVRYSLGTTPRAFEEEMRDQLAIQTLSDRAANTLTVTDAELEAAYRREADTVRLAYLLAPMGRFTAEAAIGDAEIQVYHQQHAAEFQSEPTVQVRYLITTPAPFRDQVHVSDADLLEEYLRQAPADQQGTPPTDARWVELADQLRQRRARDRAADLAWELRAQWTTSQDLATLGAPHQMTPRETAPFARQGQLEGIPSSDLFAQAAFALTSGDVSPVVETPEGYYLLTLMQRRPPHPLSLAEATPTIRQALEVRATRALAQRVVENVLATAQELAGAGTQDPLTTAARPYHLPVAQPEPVTRTSTLGDEGTAGALLGPAFTLADGQLGGPWLTARGWTAAHLIEHLPIDPEEFAKAAERLRTQLLQGKRATALEAWVQTLRDEAKPHPNPEFARPAASGSGPAAPSSHGSTPRLPPLDS